MSTSWNGKAIRRSELMHILEARFIPRADHISAGISFSICLDTTLGNPKKMFWIPDYWKLSELSGYWGMYSPGVVELLTIHALNSGKICGMCRNWKPCSFDLWLKSKFLCSLCFSIFFYPYLVPCLEKYIFDRVAKKYNFPTLSNTTWFFIRRKGKGKKRRQRIALPDVSFTALRNRRSPEHSSKKNNLEK